MIQKPLPLTTKWVFLTANQAYSGGHLYPRMAACEAALESDYGKSLLATQAMNVFGTKQHVHPIYGSISLPTKEFLANEWQTVEAAFVRYPSLADCFADRMATLTRLRDVYPHYEAALMAPDAETYVTEVSKSWSTDPDRASKCIQIYRECFPAPPQPALPGQ